MNSPKNWTKSMYGKVDLWNLSESQMWHICEYWQISYWNGEMLQKFDIFFFSNEFFLEDLDLKGFNVHCFFVLSPNLSITPVCLWWCVGLWDCDTVRLPLGVTMFTAMFTCRYMRVSATTDCVRVFLLESLQMWQVLVCARVCVCAVGIATTNQSEAGSCAGVASDNFKIKPYN